MELKAQFKSATGTDWKPSTAVPASKSVSEITGLLSQIADQGDKVRKLKADKAPKAEVEAAVKLLLELKAEYKKVSGKDWTPGAQLSAAAAATTPTPSVAANDISTQITEQGDKVRKLKAGKAPKNEIEVAVKTLLDLKGKYKAATGQDWKPGQLAAAPSSPAPAPAVEAAESPAPAPASSGSGSFDCDKHNILLEKIALQGDKVRSTKAAKADKAVIESEVKVLLALKAEFKSISGLDWKPDLKPTAPALPTASSTPSDASNLNIRITEQGEKVRKLKGDKADKSVIDSEVKVLLALKAEYKNFTGSDWKPGLATSPAPVLTPAPPKMGDNKVEALTVSVNEQGERVRILKSSGASKVCVQVELFFLSFS